MSFNLDVAFIGNLCEIEIITSTALLENSICFIYFFGEIGGYNLGLIA